MSSTAAVFDERDELEHQQGLLGNQVLAIAWLGCCAVFMLFIRHWWPNFFHHPNLTWPVQPANLLRFWPLFTYAAVMAAVQLYKFKSTEDDEQIFAYSVVTSVLAGAWEEVGYRWVFICTAMVSIVVVNWILGTLGLIIGVIVAIIGLFMAVTGGSEGRRLPGILVTAIGVAIAWSMAVSGHHDPLFWLYRVLFIPLVNFLTLGAFHSVLYNPSLPQLFTFGMVSANASFRDGHKYLGWVGWVNAWVIGFIMMYAVIQYGIGTVIVLHAVYDLEFAAMIYAGRKCFGNSE